MENNIEYDQNILEKSSVVEDAVYEVGGPEGYDAGKSSSRSTSTSSSGSGSASKSGGKSGSISMPKLSKLEQL